MDETLSRLTDSLLEELFYPKENPVVTPDGLLSDLTKVYNILLQDHNGIYEAEVADMINKIKLFGFHFASLDIRQDSRVHNEVFNTLLTHKAAAKHIVNFPADYSSLQAEERHEALLKIQGDYPTHILDSKQHCLPDP